MAFDVLDAAFDGVAALDSEALTNPEGAVACFRMRSPKGRRLAGPKQRDGAAKPPVWATDTSVLFPVVLGSVFRIA